MDAGAQFSGPSRYRREEKPGETVYGYVNPHTEREREEDRAAGNVDHLGDPLTQVTGAVVGVAHPETYFDLEKHTITKRTAAKDRAGHYEWTNLGNEGKQQQLFGVTAHHPGRVDWMIASPEHRAQAMTSLGIAALDHKRRFGAFPEASDDLSRHSYPLVKKFADKGVIKMPEGATPHHLNVQTFDPELTNNSIEEGLGRSKPVSEAEAHNARTYVRGILKQPKKTPQMEQMRIPGL